MPEIKKYINEEKKTFDSEGYLRDIIVTITTPEIQENVNRYAYAYMVIEVERAASVYRWLGTIAFWLALKGYAETVKELQEKLKK